VREAGEIGRQWLQDLGSGNFEAAWNTAVGGLLGPSGLPGSAFNVSLGAGIQTGPILNPETDIRSNFIPSLRTAIQGTLWNTQEALTTTPPPMATPLAVETPAPAPAAADVQADVPADVQADVPANAAAEQAEAVSVEAPAEQSEAKADSAPVASSTPRRAPRAKSSAGESNDAPAKSNRAARASRGAAVK
jgi:hypothetical protein